MAEKDVIVFSEDIAYARELIGGALELVGETGGQVKAFVIGSQDDAQLHIEAGAHVVYLASPVAGKPVEGYVETLAKTLEADRPLAVLVGATNRGKGFAAMLAARLGAGCTTEARNVRIEGGHLVCDRLIYGGLAVATETSAVYPHVLTAARLTFAEAEADASRAGEVIALDGAGAFAANVVEVKAKSGDSVDLAAAKSILAFGRGVNGPEDIPMMQELADLLGAELGCTRPIAEDYHWMETDRYIGLSGKSVKPQLYMTVGSSGQIQQMAGAQDSKVIAAICNDDKAPIFKVCDYGIVGDLYEVVPALIEELKKIR